MVKQQKVNSQLKDKEEIEKLQMENIKEINEVKPLHKKQKMEPIEEKVENPQDDMLILSQIQSQSFSSPKNNLTVSQTTNNTVHISKRTNLNDTISLLLNHQATYQQTIQQQNQQISTQMKKQNEVFMTNLLKFMEKKI